ncbi:lysophospholipid acyltransferase 7-like [Gigantopelta aegis]|uniref:lysophospholipid acyltransferase 7-like n=1 Tax=Gigantopelta aegis TaxID=1735272 RepID=UPI001B88B556|nr:lysophospholipid acyltransferase 7-like [Gigantopelta aegis]
MELSDDTIYGAILIFSIIFGVFIKSVKGLEQKKYLSSSVGLVTILLICRIHTIHSVVTVVGSCVILKLTSFRWCHVVMFVWCFGYLAFFRTVHWFGLPMPNPLSNAVQLLLTLRMVGLAFEIHDSRKMEQDHDNSEKTDRVLIQKYVHIKPSDSDIVCYAYCYIGILTGPYYKYRTYYDWLDNSATDQIATWRPFLSKVKPVPVVIFCFYFVTRFFSIQYVDTNDFAHEPFWFRLFYMVPMFIMFRTRLYSAWILSECMSITAALGAYPIKSKPKCGTGPTDLQALDDIKTQSSDKTVEYDFETVHNLNIYGCELAPTTREGLRSWNMTVQYWLAANVHHRIPKSLKAFRVLITMSVSAFWHGIHPGYYLSFLTVPPILMAEEAMTNAFRKGASEKQQKLFDFGCWFFKMRGFDYMCMGFLLLSYKSTIKYWMSIYFLGHIVIVMFLIIGNAARYLWPKRTKLDKKD